MTSIIVSSGNTTFDSRNNCNAIIKKSTNSLIAGCNNTVIPNSVTSIGGSSFERCTRLTSVNIPDSVELIGGYAFNGCSGLISINIPDSVTSIGDSAFNGCSGLTSIVVSSGNTTFDSRNNCNAIIKTSTNDLIAGCNNTVIPNSVTSIGQSAFSGCSGLTSIYCNSVNEPCSVVGGTFILNNSNIVGTLYVKKGGSVSTYPTWMNDQGNLGYSGSGTWAVVEYYD